MGMYAEFNGKSNPGASLGNLFSNVWGKVKSAFTAPKTAYPGANSANFQQFYQVTDDDTDMASVAKKLNLDLAQLVAVNSGIKSLPPKGSYIQTAPEQLVNQGVPASVAEQLAQTGVAPQPQVSNSFVSPTGKLNLTELNATIQNQVAQGQMPQTVSFYTPIINPATGQPATDMEMQNNGYVYDNAKKQWSLSAANQQEQPNPNAPKTNNNWQTNDALRQVSYKGKFTTNAKWAMNAYRRSQRAKRGGGPKRINQENASSVLNIQIGSG